MTGGESWDTPTTASIVRTLCNAEGCDVVLRFDGPISVPTEKYGGGSYRYDTLPKAAVNATITHASIENRGMRVICFAGIEPEELNQEGIELDAMPAEPVVGEPERYMVEITASRELGDDGVEIPMEDMERATEEGLEDNALPPWEDRPIVTTSVRRTDRCQRRFLESGYYTQYQPPNHDVGTLIDVYTK